MGLVFSKYGLKWENSSIHKNSNTPFSTGTKSWCYMYPICSTGGLYLPGWWSLSELASSAIFLCDVTAALHITQFYQLRTILKLESPRTYKLQWNYIFELNRELGTCQECKETYRLSIHTQRERERERERECGGLCSFHILTTKLFRNWCQRSKRYILNFVSASF